MYNETKDPEMFALTSEELIGMLQAKEDSLRAACSVIETELAKVGANSQGTPEAEYLIEQLASTKTQASNVAYLRTHVIPGLTHNLSADVLATLRSRCSPVDVSKMQLRPERFVGMTANAQYAPDAIGGRLW